MKPVSKGQFNWLLSAALGVIMSLVMSFVGLMMNAGWHDGFLWSWLKGFVVSFLISTPLAAFSVPPLTEWLSKYYKIED